MPDVTLYSARFNAPDLIEREKTQTLSMSLYRDGSQVTVSSGTIDIFDNNNEKVVDAAAITVVSDSATYSLVDTLVPSTLGYSSLWREEWTLVVAGETIKFTRDAHLVRRRLYPAVDLARLYARHSDLQRSFPKNRTSWQHALDEAWDVVVYDLITDGRFHYKVVSPWSLNKVLLFKALEIAFTELSTFVQGVGRYTELMDRYERKYERAWATLQFEEDADQDGATDGRQSGKAVVVTSAGPTRGRFGRGRRW